jgi:rod shape-determining protein MreC
VKVGDVVVTSGLGERFPAGFPVGTIAALRPDDTRAFLVGDVKPAAQLDRGRDVLLVRSAPQRPVIGPAAAMTSMLPTAASVATPASANVPAAARTTRAATPATKTAPASAATTGRTP